MNTPRSPMAGPPLALLDFAIVPDELEYYIAPRHRSLNKVARRPWMTTDHSPLHCSGWQCIRLVLALSASDLCM